MSRLRADISPDKTAAEAVQEVHILMGVFNGAAYLPAQLQSLSGQSHGNWVLTCSDDGSTDGTQDLVRAFVSNNPQRVCLQDGPRAGFSENFMGLIRSLGDAAGLVAFADQDDLWLPEKLARAVALLNDVPVARPALYCSRVLNWDPAADRRRISRALHRPPSFRNALIENVAQGNTIVLNAAAARLARDAARRTGAMFAHDWWLYLLISGAGGEVIHDARPGLLYRQHGGNILGSGAGLRAQIRRKRQVLRGAFRARVGGNIAAMQRTSLIKN